ncbi:MAG: tRNA uridine-5-carboxymethylaminomethyl(34) synthesis GTPase MnmE, partial [Candidatus Latescibacteria bacterium]|nr:tRNA uridine-5-carboxymethylaminomethyl(34) synthesis GTPase MnmE [Candidatus Latescibacterota bacterium]
MNASDNDTIVAIATAPGEGALGIIRLSGSCALSISGRCFHGRERLDQSPNHTLAYGHFHNHGQDLDEILASVMRAPHSYTGEDTVEFNCHGGPFLLRRLLGVLIDAGARP